MSDTTEWGDYFAYHGDKARQMSEDRDFREREVRSLERIAAALEELATSTKQVHGDLSRMSTLAADITGRLKRPRKKNPV